ncbi:MAG: PE family protein [Mycobacterium sp.]
MAASASAASAALLGATPMGADADSVQFAAALNAAGAAYLGTTAEHTGQRAAYAGAQSLASSTYALADTITKSAFLT